MGRQKTRTRTVAKDTSVTKLTIRPEWRDTPKGGYQTYLVQGWKEGGKWKRKRFKDETEAKRFVTLKEIELANEGRKQRMVLSPLSDNQIEQAVRAFDRLGDTYSLDQAIEFFLQNHRAPDYTISLHTAMVQFIGERETSVRSNTNRNTESVLNSFTKYLDDCEVHEVTPQKVVSFLKSLRAKDQVSPAKRKTWNNYRNELNLFFKWASMEDKDTNRPYIFNNPVEKVEFHQAKRVAEQRAEIVTTDVETLLEMMTHLMCWKDGVLAKYYALTYFAGIRPDGEMHKLSEHETNATSRNSLINLKTNTITISPSIAKTGEKRQIEITPNLKKWLEAYPDHPIIPTNFDRLNKAFRKKFELTQDETRHSFITYHVALNRSIGDASLQAGNSEAIVKKHYFNHRPKEEGQAYFSIIPNIEKGGALVSKDILSQEKKNPHLKAI